MKIIFLDIDGVLCNFRSHVAFGSPGPGMNALDPVGIGLLNMLTDKSTFFVLSSAWRKWHTKDYIEEHLRLYGWTGEFHRDWKTEDFDATRGEQINEWLVRHSSIKEFVIFDDDRDMMPHQKRNYVKTDYNAGISWNNFKQAAKILFGSYEAYRSFYDKHKHLGVLEEND